MPVGLEPGGDLGTYHRAHSFRPLAEITFKAADRTAIAAQRFDGLDTGPNHDQVTGLPTLMDYPTLGSLPMDR